MTHTMITDPEQFFASGCGRCVRFATPDCSTRLWLGGILELRRICRDLGLVETAKWGHPVYMRGDRNIAMIGAFRGNYTLTFFNPSLMKDPEGLLVKAGPNAQNPSLIAFDDNAKPAALADTITAYLQEAMSYADAGIKPEKRVVELELPDELVDALDDDPELAEAYQNLTPGRQKSYIFALNSAKTAATRIKRIEKYRDKIIAGKGALDR